MNTDEPDSSMPRPGSIPPTPASTKPKPSTDSASQLSSVTRIESGADQARIWSFVSKVRQWSATIWNGLRTRSRISRV